MAPIPLWLQGLSWEQASNDFLMRFEVAELGLIVCSSVFRMMFRDEISKIALVMHQTKSQHCKTMMLKPL